MSRKLVFAIAVFTVFYTVQSAPVDDESKAVVQKYEFQPNIGDGSYKFLYETSNGLTREEEGIVKLNKENKEYIAVKGYYRYYSEKGRITVNYEADEDGYKQTIDEEEPVGIPSPVLGSLIGGGLG